MPSCARCSRLPNLSFLRRSPNNIPFHFPSAIHLQVIFAIDESLAREPLPCVELDEIVERPRFLRQFFRVRRPNICLAFDRRVEFFRRVRRKGFRCGGGQVQFIFPGGTGDSVFRELVCHQGNDGTQGVDQNLPPDIFLISES